MRQVIQFHLDENVDGAVGRGLRDRGFDVTMPTEVGLREAEDARHLAFALSEERVLFTHDADFLRLQRIISTFAEGLRIHDMPMILRLSQKLSTKIKAGKLSEMPLDKNLYADWSCHLFTADRTQYILLSNTPSLYSCVMYGKGITNDRRFMERVLSTIREFMEDDGQALVYQRFIAPSSASVNFAKALDRRVTGSMNELVLAATHSLQSGEVAPHDVGFGLNDLLLSAIATKEDQGYGRPKEAFKRLSMEKK
jgi:hypothetical protein